MNFWNVNTREYDHKSHAIETSKPLRYHLMDSEQLQQNRMGPFDIITSNELRSAPTRLNHQDIPSTPLYGTAPFKARNAGPVDIESSLIQGNRYETGMCTRPQVEEHLYFENHVQLPFPMKTHDIVDYGISTRAQIKNTIKMS